MAERHTRSLRGTWLALAAVSTNLPIIDEDPERLRRVARSTRAAGSAGTAVTASVKVTRSVDVIGGNLAKAMHRFGVPCLASTRAAAEVQRPLHWQSQRHCPALAIASLRGMKIGAILSRRRGGTDPAGQGSGHAAARRRPGHSDRHENQRRRLRRDGNHETGSRRVQSRRVCPQAGAGLRHRNLVIVGITADRA